MRRKQTTHRRWLALLSAAAAGLSLQAGEVFYDFNTEPAAGTFTTFGTAPYPEWRASGGKDDSGYYAITDAMNSLSGTLILPDIDGGKVIKAFEFSVDVRIGDGTGNPADGFSINYARAGDPVLTSGSGYVSGAMEEGTTTGLGVSFDTYDNGGGDVVGISVRVDGTIVHSKAYPTRNGQAGDLASLQTGPQSDTTGLSLPWEPFTVKLTESGALTITYKSDIVVSNLQTAFFPSPGRMVFAARTGGENENHHIDNLRLKTTPATSPTVGVIIGQPSGFILPIDDSGTIQPRVDTIVAKLNGTTVTPTATRTGAQTVLSFNVPGAFFTVGSTQEVSLTFTDSAGAPVTANRSFVVQNYTLLGSGWKTTNFAANSSGFNVRTTQISGGRYPGDPNSIASGETQLAGGIIDPATGAPYDNIADLSTADPNTGLFVAPVINWDQEGLDVDATTQPDNFNTAEPASNPIPNTTIPGIPAGLQDNIAAEITTCLELKRGTYVFGVNSDDGFLATLGHSPLGPVLGSYSGGRGASDTLFTIAVEEDGVYPIRLSWWEGGGGANIEFFSVNPITGEKTLVNDRTQASAVKAYNVCGVPAYVESILPAEGAIGVGIRPTIKVVLQDDLTAVDDASVKIILDGQLVNSTVSNSGTATTVTAALTNPLEYRSVHTGQVIFTAGGVTTTNEFNFEVEARGFSIEAEDFDFGSGQFMEVANTMPYLGGAYAGLDAVSNVDYRQSYNEVNGDAYRSLEDPNVPMGGNNDQADRERPGFVVDNGSNWSIGWAGGGEWYNYTRTFTNGNYKIIAAQSHGDAAGLPNRLVAGFGVVLEGVGTPDQTVVRVGSYSHPSTGAWGNNAVHVAEANGAETVVHLNGQTTIRVWIDSGDFDWFALIPTSEAAIKPFVLSMTPSRPQRSITEVSFELTEKVSDTTINQNSIQLSINGQAVTGVQVTDTALGAEVRYTAATSLPVGENSYTLTYQDSAGSTITSSGKLYVIGQENFVIEAEDYNYEGGKTVAQASTMPLQSSLYADLVPVHDVDYHVNQDEPSGNIYRTTEVPNVPTSEQNGELNRGSFDLTANYRIGWVDNGEWWNYTRTIPAGTYNVYAALSRDGGTMGGRLGLVADATVQNQTVTELGTFQAPASGAWGDNEFVAMQASDGSLAAVNLGGTQTLRFSSDFGNGDIDYLLFVKTEGGTVDQPELSISKAANGQITISWTGGGTLQATAQLGANAQWTDVSGAGSATITANQAQQFFRVRK